MTRVHIVYAAVLVLAMASAALAQGVPQSITYQGKLTDALGQPVNGPQDMRFVLFSGQTTPPGTVLWDSGHMTVPVVGGVFTVALGTPVHPIDSSTLSGGNVWIEVSVGSEVLPRTQFTASPFALRAEALNLPFSGTANTGLTAFSVDNDGSGYGIYAHSQGGYGLYGDSDGGSAAGVFGTAASSYGVQGASASKYGVYGTGSQGVRGLNPTSGNYGYLGNADFGAYGKNNTSGNYGHLGSLDFGVFGYAAGSKNRAVYGINSTGTEAWLVGSDSAVSGYAVSPASYGFRGSGPFAGVYGTGGHYGIHGSTLEPAGVGVYGEGWTGVSGWGQDRGVTGRGIIGLEGLGDQMGVFGNDLGADGWAGFFSGRGTFLGRLGVGLSTPAKMLHVQESVAGDISYALKLDNQDPTLNKSGTGILFSVGGSGDARGKGALVYQCTQTWNRGDFHFLQDTTADEGNCTIGNAVMTIRNDGRVGIKTTNPQYDLHVNGSVAGVGAYNNLSDLRLKSDVRALPDALAQVMRLQGVSFSWRRDEHPELNFSKGRHLGFIAQEVEKVLPEAVSKDGNGLYSVAYDSVIPVLVEAVKTQQQQIESQQKRLEDLERLVAELASRR